jgi:hypothetical protein
MRASDLEVGSGVDALINMEFILSLLSSWVWTCTCGLKSLKSGCPFPTRYGEISVLGVWEYSRADVVEILVFPSPIGICVVISFGFFLDITLTSIP